MKKLALILSLAISVIAVSSENGKCCQSSDGGRSDRYGVALRRAAMPRTCSCLCGVVHPQSQRPGKDQAPSCARRRERNAWGSGVYVGPYSGWQFAGMQRM